MIDVGHLTVFGSCVGDRVRTTVTSPLLTCPAPSPATASTPPSPRTTARSTASSARSSRGEGFVDLSHRDVVRVAGPDRLTWLHSLTTQHFVALAPKAWTGALVLSPQGHVEHAFFGYDDGEAFTAHTEPGAAAALVEFLDRMRFMMRVEVTDVTAELAVTWRPAGATRRRRTPATSSSRATSSRRTPRPPGRPAACGRSRRCGSRAASPGSASTPTTARSPTRPAGSAPPCTSTRAATAARRPSRGCTRSAGRRAG